jgi:prophage tail gpP-like protein
VPSPDSVTLLIGNRAHSDWESYDIDSDLMTPADAWRVTLGMQPKTLPPFVQPGEPVQIKVGKDTILSGRIDEVSQSIGKSEHTLDISGRDGAAVLVDCSAPIFTARQIGLEDIIAKVVRPLGIGKIRIDAAATARREKVQVEPGESAWAMLQAAAEANGLWPWFDPDGTLVVGGPDYSSAPVATLTLRLDGKANNVESLSKTDSVAERHSEVTVLGQTWGTERADGQHNIRYTQKDSGVAWYRPRIELDHEADSIAIAKARARKLLSDERLSGLTLRARVMGHRTPSGILWTPGQRVSVKSEPHRIDGTFFLMGRRFTLSRTGGTLTELTLKEDGVWLLDAHPTTKKGTARTKAERDLEANG